MWISEDHLVRLNIALQTDSVVSTVRERWNRIPEGKWNRTWNLYLSNSGRLFSICDLICVWKINDRVPVEEWAGDFSIRSLIDKISFGSYSESKSEIGFICSFHLKTRTRVIYSQIGWNTGNTVWRSAPTSLETLADNLWIVVKCQSNPELAGSPRNTLRRSVWCSSRGVKPPFRCGLRERYQIETNSEYPVCSQAVRLWGISSMVERETAQTAS